ncbi:multidrug transporter [Pseudomonas sp. W2-17]|uniref:multidrug transporter n=1 Tax=Pseudomonas sp. W2-17 TaxID=3058039 RepID=UPI0034E0D2DF
MIFGAVLLFTWLVLLLRYPSKALPVSLAAAVGLSVVAAFVVWEDSREEQRLERLQMRVNYAPQQCPTGRPLLVLIDNGNSVSLTQLRWKIAAYAPGDTVNLAEDTYTAPRYRGPGDLLPGSQWQDCLPMPPLRPGYRPQTLEFRAERLQGRFSG